MHITPTPIRRTARLAAASRYCGVALVAVATAIASTPALADPASNAVAPNFSQTTAGAVATTVPDGICSAITSARGGAGASSGTTAVLGGVGAGGAVINARFNVLPGQAVSGAVAGGGNLGNEAGNPVTNARGGTGTAAGGNGGTIASATVHRGGGGGGSSSISVGGIKMVEAGGGGGGGAAHQAPTLGAGGGGGFSGIAPGVVAVGISGNLGNNTTNNGGQGGQAAAGGLGGVQTLDTSDGFNGGGIGTGTGGNGGVDTGTDSGGGGGGGYTGGGGGSGTQADSATGAGGGGGSSFVRGTSPTVAALAPTAVSGSARPTTAQGPVAGAAGLVTIDWVPCVYTLVAGKTASVASVNAGGTVRWTITVRNSGPDPMTKGDLVTLTDTLPAGGGSTFRVVSLISTAGSTDPNLSSGAVTCTGVTVGGTMPATTDCSRTYSAPSAPGAPTGGTRGLNSGETLTIVYDQIFNNAVPASTVTNQVTTVDRSGTSGTTDIIGVNATRTASAPVNILPYDLRVTKSASSATVGVGTAMTWTVNVTNLGPGDMFGPDASVANPLIVSDVAPTTNVSAPVSFSSSGPAGSCTYASGTITCASGLAFGATQTFTFQQTVNAAAPAGATVSNTASVTDYFASDSNDSQSASFSITPSSNLVTTKTRTSASATPAVGQTVSYQITVTNSGPSAATNVSLTDTLPAGLTAAVGNGAVSQGSYSAGTGLWTVGSLANGASATLTLVGTVNAGQGGLTITNTTTAASTPDQPDPTTGGDDLNEVVTVFLPAIVAAPDSVSGINGADGAANVLNVLGSDTLNAVAATTSTVAISQTAAASHPGVTLNTATGSVSVAAGTPAGTYTIGYRICEIANPTNCANSTATVTVNPSADLRIVKSDGVSTVTSGSTVTYTVTVTNSGADTITGALITDVVGTGLTCPAGNAVTITGSGIPAGSFTIANLTGAGLALGTLTSGQSAILTYSCQVN
jgi:uncharacterized repeat protein (TIGR01451 family)